MVSRCHCSPHVMSPASMLYQALVSGWTWSRMIVCFVVFKASGRGGFTFFNDFGPWLLLALRTPGSYRSPHLM